MYQPEVPVLHGADAISSCQDACACPCTTDTLRSRARTNQWVQSGDTHDWDAFPFRRLCEGIAFGTFTSPSQSLPPSLHTILSKIQGKGTSVKPSHCAVVVCIWHLQLHVYVMSPASYMVCLLDILRKTGSNCTDADPGLASCIQRKFCLITAGSRHTRSRGAEYTELPRASLAFSL